MGGVSCVCFAAGRDARSHPLPVVSSASRLMRLVGRLVVASHVLRAWMAWRACSSHCCRSSRAVGCAFVLVSFSRLVGASRRRGVIDGLPVAVAWRACGSRGCVLSHRLVGAWGFGFSSYLGGERMSGCSRLAVSEPVLACLGAVGGCGDVVLVIGVPSCPLSSYGCVAWGRAASPIWLVVACFLPRGCRSCLVPFIRFEAAGREAGRRAAWLSWRGSS